MKGRGDLERLNALEESVVAALGREGGSAWEVGVALAKIEDDELYRARRYRNFAVYAREIFGLERTMAYVYRALAQFPREAVEECGPIKVNLAAQYFRLTPETEDPAAIGRALFPIEVNGKITPTRLQKCGKRDLQQLIARTKGRSSVRVLPAELQRFVTMVQTLMKHHEGFTFGAVEVGDRARLDGKGVYLDNAWDYAQALLQALTALGYRPAGESPRDGAPAGGPTRPAPGAAPARVAGERVWPRPGTSAPSLRGSPASRGYLFNRPLVPAPGAGGAAGAPVRRRRR